MTDVLCKELSRYFPSGFGTMRDIVTTTESVASAVFYLSIRAGCAAAKRQTVKANNDTNEMTSSTESGKVCQLAKIPEAPPADERSSLLRP